MQKLWSTNTVDECNRLSYWVEAVCDTYVQLDCDTPDLGGSFHGQIEVDQLSTLGLSRVTASQWVRRTPAKIAQATEDFFLVSIQTDGRGTILQVRRARSIAPSPASPVH
jgi:hypothetical protein